MTGQSGQDVWENTTEMIRSISIGLTGHPGKDREERTAETRKFSENRRAGPRGLEENSMERSARSRQLGQGNLDREGPTVAGQP
jgi:hypothetical protein